MMRNVLFILLMLAGCTTFPALEGTISDAARNAPYPTLTARPTGLGDTADPVDDALQARIDALNLRAEALRATEFDALQ